MGTPCEVVIWYILPSLRKELTVELIKAHGFTQSEVARRLHVSEAAVSQYLSSKRARVKLDDDVVMAAIKDWSAKMAADKAVDIDNALCSLCMSVRDSGLLERLKLVGKGGADGCPAEKASKAGCPAEKGAAK